MAYINGIISNFILFTSQELGTFWQNIVFLNFSFPQVIIDILFVSTLFYFLFLLVRGSRAFHILLGLFIVAILFLLSKWLQLMALGWLLDHFLTVILVAIPVIFQQELRTGLEKLGKTKIFHVSSAEKMEHIIQQILAATEFLASRKTGALIVLRNEVALSEYAETGVSMGADISKELLLSIFKKNSPLHDGAIIIEGTKIRAAACILPPSFKNYGHDFGTRHKAAIGLSEATDAQIIVISEEKASISYAKDGKMERDINLERLGRLLKSFYKPKTKKTKK